jgi:3'-phosphoadenosine 5'-phosphosulfate (PAPS) 3'-phosphatase
VKEAGGKITDCQGKLLGFNNENTRHKNGFVVSNGRRHKEIIKAL